MFSFTVIPIHLSRGHPSQNYPKSSTLSFEVLIWWSTEKKCISMMWIKYLNIFNYPVSYLQSRNISISGVGSILSCSLHLKVCQKQLIFLATSWHRRSLIDLFDPEHLRKGIEMEVELYTWDRERDTGRRKNESKISGSNLDRKKNLIDFVDLRNGLWEGVKLISWCH